MKGLKLAAIISLLVFSLLFCACGAKEPQKGNDSADSDVNNAGDAQSADTGVKDTDNAEAAVITFSGNSISASAESSRVIINGSSLTVVSGGSYILTGKLDDGEVIVDAPKTEKVTLILDGVDITSSDGAAIYVKSCDKVVISTKENTQSTLTDGKKYILPAGETKPNACLYSSEDIDFEGNGKLTVIGNYNNGIGSKNDIDIESGAIEVSAPNNAIKGNDSVTISGGSVKITAADDGIKADTEDKAEKGFVSISGGEIEIICDDDAVSAYSYVSITGGRIITKVGDKAVNCDGNITLAEGVLTEK